MGAKRKYLPGIKHVHMILVKIVPAHSEAATVRICTVDYMNVYLKTIPQYAFHDGLQWEVFDEKIPH